MNGYTKWGLNVFGTVGIGGANNPGDVMVIQAMFRYLVELRGAPIGKFESDLYEKLTLEPTGQISRKTNDAILAYQYYYSHSILNVDGIIHPAKYENRNIKLEGKWMTITHLHSELWSAIGSGPDYTIEIARRFPHVAFWIR